MEELLALDQAAFEKQIGKRAIRSARKLLSGVTSEVSPSVPRGVSFPAMGITVRFLPASRLDLAVCNCSESPPCSHVLPALLVLRGESKASPPATADQTVQPEWTDAMRRAEELLCEMYRMGLDGLSLAWCEAAMTTSLEIRKCGLPIPAELLERLGKDVHEELTHATSSAGRIRWHFAALWLRVLAWRSATAVRREDDLISRPPQVYWTASARTLVGVGVRGWTNDELVGITLYMLDLTTGSIVSTGTARPRAAHLDAETLAASAPILGGYTAREVLGRQIAATATRLSTEGRIRLAPDATIESLSTPVHWPTLIRDHGVSRWNSLADRLEESFPTLATLSRPLVHWFLPAEMEAPIARTGGQDFVWPMRDLDGRRLEVAYHYSRDRAVSFHEIRRFASSYRPKAILGSLRWTAGVARVEPLTFVYLDNGQWTAYCVDIDRAAGEDKTRGKRRLARRR